MNVQLMILEAFCRDNKKRTDSGETSTVYKQIIGISTGGNSGSSPPAVAVLVPPAQHCQQVCHSATSLGSLPALGGGAVCMGWYFGMFVSFQAAAPCCLASTHSFFPSPQPQPCPLPRDAGTVGSEATAVAVGGQVAVAGGTGDGPPLSGGQVGGSSGGGAWAWASGCPPSNAAVGMGCHGHEGGWH